MVTLRLDQYRWCAVMMCVFFAGCAAQQAQAPTAKEGTIVVAAGTQIPALGLAFDVSYDPSTDRIIPGYRFLQVAIRNNSLSIIPLDPRQDRWSVVDRRGNRRRAVMNLRESDPDVWAKLPARLRQLIEYPLLVEIGTTQAIDLIFPDRLDLSEFRSAIFESAGLNRIIEVYARETGPR
ncbi:MAG: hypothetical protein HY696_02960 [Deltaproteobacteria bacterium]|nr:hypothetical protein [Deltaproteobacteria bacterium]